MFLSLIYQTNKTKHMTHSKAKQDIQTYIQAEIAGGYYESATTMTDFLFDRKADYFAEAGISRDMVYEWVYDELNAAYSFDDSFEEA
jgi:hypothetical protein